MATTQFVVKKALQGGWTRESEQSWTELELDDGNIARLVFADDFLPKLKFSLQTLQRHVSGERRKVGLPIIQHSYTDTVKRLEYGHDDVNQLAIIRTRFHHGGSQDTVIEKAQIQQTIEHLQNALQAFENLSKSEKH